MSIKGLGNKSSAELSQMLADRENELQSMIAADFEVEQAILKIQNTILGLQKEKKELEIAKSKSGYNLKSKKLEISLLTKMFWKNKNSGT